MIKRVLGAMLLALAVVVPAGAQTPGQIDNSPNLSLVASIPYGGGTDLAFKGHYAFAGDWDGADAGVRIIDIADPARPKVVGHFLCSGSQNDVSVWGDLLFMSVDGRRASEACNAPTGGRTEGVRIVDISNLAKPKMIKFIQTECGSHTHTLLPDPANGRVLIYVQSAGPGARTEAVDGVDAECNRATHTRESVIEVPTSNPRAARVAARPSVAYGSGMSLQAGTPFVGCHDMTLFMPGKLAGAACYDETQLWDISNPMSPRILSHIASSLDAPIDIHHTTAFSWDGKTMVLGDEAGGRTGPACSGLADDRLGALYFYDVSDPATPVLKSRFSLPRTRVLNCTAHLFNVVPTPHRNVLVMAWYTGGINVIDFTDPAAPVEIAHYAQVPSEPTGELPTEPTFDTWSAYWYNGFIYVNGFDGFNVFKLDDPAVEDAMRLEILNPQTQVAAAEPARPTAKPTPIVLGRTGRRGLPSTGVAGVPWPYAFSALAAAAGVTRFLVRRT